MFHRTKLSCFCNVSYSYRAVLSVIVSPELVCFSSAMIERNPHMFMHFGGGAVSIIKKQCFFKITYCTFKLQILFLVVCKGINHP